MAKTREYTEVLSDLYNMPDTKVWVSPAGDSIEVVQGTDVIVLPRDAFARFVDEVYAIIDKEAQS